MISLKWRSRQRTDRGFSLFEAVVAVFVATLFFLLLIQSSTLNSVSKAQAQEATEILGWLQKDIEAVKAQASTLQLASVRYAVQGSPYLMLNNPQDEQKFRAGDIISFVTSNPDGRTYTLKDRRYNVSGILSLTSTLKATYPSNSLIIVRSRQQASVTTTIPKGSKTVYLSDVNKIDPGSQLMFADLDVNTSADDDHEEEISQQMYDVVNVFNNNSLQIQQPLKVSLNTNNSVNLARCSATQNGVGYADDLRDQLMGVDEETASSRLTLAEARTQTSRGKQYQITRVMDIVDSPPFNMLQVHYEISPPLPDVISLHSFVTRFMPDVAFYCN